MRKIERRNPRFGKKQFRQSELKLSIRAVPRNLSARFMAKEIELKLKAGVHLLAIVLILFVSSALSASCKELESVTLQLKWKHQFQFAGYYAAIEQGYYRDAGLDVKLVEGGPHTDFAAELFSNQVQYAVALPVMLKQRNEGFPVVALAAIFQHSPEVLLVRESSEINTPQQLANRKVMLAPDDTPAVLAMFRNEGLPPDSVHITPYDFDLDKLIRSNVDGIAGYTTDEPFYFKQKDVPIRFIQPRNYGVDLYGDCLFTSGNELAKHPERVRAFREASLKGWQYAMHHVDEMVDLIVTKYHSEKSREFLHFEAEQMSQLMFADLIEIGHMNPGRWKHIGDTYVKLGMLKPDYSLDGFIYDPNVPRNLAWVWWAIGVSLSCSLLLIGIIFIQRRIHQRTIAAEQLAERVRKIESLHRFTVGVSHHFNNILQAIVISAELAEEAAKASAPADEHVRQILEHVQRATDLSRVLLASIGFGTYDFQPLRLDDFLREILPEIDRSIPGSHKLRLIANAGGIVVQADQQALKQIMVNLITNAFEAAKNSGEVLVQTGRTHCTAAYLAESPAEENLPEGEYVYVDVIDKGEGMSAEVLKKAFDPFFSSRHQGRGLGMAVVLGIIRIHRGVIKINSIPNEGTTVRVLFPLN